jgi:hypothetical protein
MVIVVIALVVEVPAKLVELIQALAPELVVM